MDQPAVKKSRVADIRNAVGDNNARQAGAARERIIANAGHAVASEVKADIDTINDKIGEVPTDSTVMAEIEKASAEGFFKTAPIRKDGGINYHYLRHYIESFGYKVESNSHEYTIYW